MASSGPFRMGAVGDINLEGFATDPNPFRHLMPYLSQLNLVVGNLEGLLAEPTELFYKRGFKHVGEGRAPSIAGAGIRMLNMASNVTYGAEAIDTTVKQLDAEGIAHSWHVLPGHHNGDDYWGPHSKEYLRFYAAALSG